MNDKSAFRASGKLAKSFSESKNNVVILTNRTQKPNSMHNSLIMDILQTKEWRGPGDARAIREGALGGGCVAGTFFQAG